MLQPLVGSSTGNVGTVTWAIVVGTLPPGVVLDPVSGNISGTPLAFGRFDAVVKVEDSWDSATRVVIFPVTIDVAPTAVSITTTTLSPGVVGSAYSATLSGSGGTGALAWSLVGTAPAWLTLSADGILSGTPTAGGIASFTVQAADAGWPGNVATANLQVPVGTREIVLYAAEASQISGTWRIVADPSAAGGARIANPDANAAKVSAPLANPVNYFELTFEAEAGLAYHLWLRGKADKNNWANDSVFVQFSDSVGATGAPLNRIGTTGGATVSIEDGTGGGLANWGWADDSYGGVAGPMYFATSGTHTVRIQVREDGLSLDQIVFSSDRYRIAAPGATKNDATILPR